MKQITHVRPFSLFHLFLPQLFVAWAVFWVSWFSCIGGSRELVLMVGQALGGSGLIWTFAVLIPANGFLGILGLAAFAAVYNRYNRGLLTLDLELTPLHGEDHETWLLEKIRPRSLGNLFMPLLAAAAVNVLGVMGLWGVLGIGAALFGEQPGLGVLLFNGLLGSIMVAGLIVLGCILAAVIYNRVATGGDGVRLRMTSRDHSLILSRFSLKTLHYALPSFLALTVIAVVLELILGMGEWGSGTADALFSVGVTVPTLWLVPALYNALSGQGGITFKLKKKEF
ncbi:hypothetical protein KAU45_03725 [bacterium]|nr:hypothetical protein [bacterium]